MRAHALALAILCVSASGCEDPTKDCNNSSECSSDQLCCNGTCRQTCNEQQPDTSGKPDSTPMPDRTPPTSDSTPDAMVEPPDMSPPQTDATPSPPPDTGPDSAPPDSTTDVRCVPVPEICDGLDNDCNNEIDEGFEVGQPCTVGTGECEETGHYICTEAGDGVVCDASPGDPTAEICDGVDNNCDGVIDEGYEVGEPCTVGTGECEETGHYICTEAGDGVVCDASPGDPTAETCDGDDNDCDGEIDEDVINVCGGCATLPDPDMRGRPCDISVDDGQCGIWTCNDAGNDFDCTANDTVAVCTDCEPPECLFLGIWKGTDNQGVEWEGTRWDDSVWAP